MSQLWPRDQPPPSVEEVVRAARDHLAAWTWFDSEDSIAGNFLLLEEEADSEPPYGVVLQQREPGGSIAQQPGLRDCIVIVRFECPDDWRNWDAWHYQHHAQTSQALRGFTPTLTTGVPLGSFTQHAYADTAVVDPDNETRYSASSFHIKLKPYSN